MRRGPFHRRRQRRNRLRTLFDLRHRLWQRTLQGHSQHLVHGIDEVQLHRGAEVFRHFGDILLVVLRQNDLEQPGTMRSQKFFLQSANRQYFAAKRDLARHGQITTDWNLT